MATALSFVALAAALAIPVQKGGEPVPGAQYGAPLHSIGNSKQPPLVEVKTAFISQEGMNRLLGPVDLKADLYQAKAISRATAEKWIKETYDSKEAVSFPVFTGISGKTSTVATSGGNANYHLEVTTTVRKDASFDVAISLRSGRATADAKFKIHIKSGEAALLDLRPEQDPSATSGLLIEPRITFLFN